MQRTKNSRDNLKKIEIILLYMKTYYKGVVIKRVWYSYIIYKYAGQLK